MIVPDQVKNGTGTSICPPRGYSSWIAYHCAIKRGNPYTICSIQGCKGTDLVGGHVIVKVKGRTKTPFYILPICGTCNHVQNTDWMPVKDGRRAVKVTSAVSDEPCLTQQ